MQRTLLVLSLCLPAACQNTPPEGRYPCHPETVATDCPRAWWCRADHTCWITPDDGGIDGGADAGHDAAALRDAASDASLSLDACVTTAEICDGVDNDCNGRADDNQPCIMGVSTNCATSCGSTGTGVCSSTCALPTGTSCTAPTETCNGNDDDCDAIADEGLLQVGAPTVAVSGGATRLTGARLLAVGSGYVLVALTNELGERFVIQSLDGSGNAIGPATTLAGPTSPPGAGISLHAAGANILIAYTGSSGSAVVLVNPAGTILWGPASLPSDPALRPSYHMVVADASATRATLYADYHSLSTPTVYSIKRYRIDLTASTTAFVTNTTEVVASAAGPSILWDVVATSAAEYLIYRDPVGSAQLVAVAVGDATTGRTVLGPVIGPADGATLATLAIAISDPAQAVSGTNPLAVVWQDVSGATATDHFIEVRGATTSTFSVGSAIVLGGGRGAADANYGHRQDSVAILPAPNASAVAHLSHWIVATSDVTSGTLSLDHAWTVAGDYGAPVATTLTIPMPAESVRSGIGLATNGSGVRFATVDSAGDAVTRRVGCF